MQCEWESIFYFFKALGLGVSLLHSIGEEDNRGRDGWMALPTQWT